MKSSQVFHPRPDGISWREIEGEVIVLDLASSKYLRLNASGGVLWEAVQAGATTDELVSRLVEEFAIDQETAQKDVIHFVQACTERELLVAAVDPKTGT
jgi:hypothetical protein